MILNEEETRLLTQIGLTKTQAKIYRLLLKTGTVDARTLSDISNSQRPLVYRTLDELQKIGLVEKEINVPYKFKAAPPDSGLQILVYQEFQHYKEIQEKTKFFLRKIENDYIESPQKQEYKVKMVENKERILQIMNSQHKNAQQSIDILSTFQRWLHIVDHCFENYKKALKRNVKYRIVVDKPEKKMCFPEKLQFLLKHPNFQLKLSGKSLRNDLAIFDGREATFNFIPSKSLKESPVIWTNHPSFVLMAQDHFAKVWKSAHEYKFEQTELCRAR